MLLIGFLFLIVYISLHFTKVLSPSTIVSEIIIGLVTTLVGNIAGLLFAMFKTDVNKAKMQNQDEFIQAERAELLQLFGENFWEELSRKILNIRADPNLVFFKGAFLQRLNPILSDIYTSNQLLLNSLHKEKKRIDDLIDDYKLQTKNFYDKYSFIFVESDRNSDKIGLITKTIKEIAIKPSFELIKETTEQLEEVKLQITQS